MIRYALASILVLLTLANAARATELPFDAVRFDQAQAGGAATALVFHADWCPTCRAQAPVLKELAQRPEFSKLTVFVASFDDEKSLKKHFKVTRQSTVIAFKGTKEVGRSTGDTTRDGLRMLLSLSLQ